MRLISISYFENTINQQFLIDTSRIEKDMDVEFMNVYTNHNIRVQNEFTTSLLNIELLVDQLVASKNFESFDYLRKKAIFWFYEILNYTDNRNVESSAVLQSRNKIMIRRLASIYIQGNIHEIENLTSNILTNPRKIPKVLEYYEPLCDTLQTPKIYEMIINKYHLTPDINLMYLICKFDFKKWLSNYPRRNLVSKIANIIISCYKSEQFNDSKMLKLWLFNFEQSKAFLQDQYTDQNLLIFMKQIVHQVVFLETRERALEIFEHVNYQTLELKDLIEINDIIRRILKTKGDTLKNTENKTFYSHFNYSKLKKLFAFFDMLIGNFFKDEFLNLSQSDKRNKSPLIFTMNLYQPFLTHMNAGENNSSAIQAPLKIKLCYNSFIEIIEQMKNYYPYTMNALVIKIADSLISRDDEFYIELANKSLFAKFDFSSLILNIELVCSLTKIGYSANHQLLFTLIKDLDWSQLLRMKDNFNTLQLQQLFKLWIIVIHKSREEHLPIVNSIAAVCNQIDWQHRLNPNHYQEAINLYLGYIANYPLQHFNKGSQYDKSVYDPQGYPQCLSQCEDNFLFILYLARCVGSITPSKMVANIKCVKGWIKLINRFLSIENKLLVSEINLQNIYLYLLNLIPLYGVQIFEKILLVFLKMELSGTNQVIEKTHLFTVEHCQFAHPMLQIVNACNLSIISKTRLREELLFSVLHYQNKFFESAISMFPIFSNKRPNMESFYINMFQEHRSILNLIVDGICELKVVENNSSKVSDFFGSIISSMIYLSNKPNIEIKFLYLLYFYSLGISHLENIPKNSLSDRFVNLHVCCKDALEILKNLKKKEKSFYHLIYQFIYETMTVFFENVLAFHLQLKEYKSAAKTNIKALKNGNYKPFKQHILFFQNLIIRERDEFSLRSVPNLILQLFNKILSSNEDKYLINGLVQIKELLLTNWNK